MAKDGGPAFDIRIKDEDLPVLSTIATRILGVVESSDTSTKDLEKLIRLDPALTLRILRLANSPVYGGRVKTASVDQAIVRLGLKELKRATVIAATGEVFQDTDPYVKIFWRHAVAVALISHRLSKDLGVGEPEECFVAGLVHDVGKVIIYRQAADLYGGLVDEAALNGSRFYKHERRKMNYCSHETIGALVGRKWDLTPETVEIIRFHHDIEDKPEMSDQASPTVALISISNLLANRLGFGTESPRAIELIESIPARALDMNATVLEELLKTLPALIEEEQESFL